MTIVTNYAPTGHSGSYSTTSGIYTVAGTLTTNADDDLVTIKGTVTKTADSSNIGTFSLYFVSGDDSIQDAVMSALKAVRTAVQADIDA
jgi:hypothetical protein